MIILGSKGGVANGAVAGINQVYFISVGGEQYIFRILLSDAGYRDSN